MHATYVSTNVITRKREGFDHSFHGKSAIDIQRAWVTMVVSKVNGSKKVSGKSNN